MSLEFLRLLYPNGLWILTAVHPERKGIETRTFTPETEKQAQAFIDKHNGTWNLYYSVNQTRRPVEKKALREDIATLNYLHVDLDARVGEDLDEELQRLEKLISTPMSGVPEPTFIIFSGGGYQALWKLEEPFLIDGQEGKFEEAKRFNMQLEMLYGGDATHNVDRIMRLPGTWNVPGAKKLKKGRKKVEAELVAHVPRNEYPLSKFTPAPKTQQESTNTPTTAKIIQLPQTEGEVPRVMDLEELNDYNVPDRLKVVIAQGEHPEEMKEGDNSRSAWLFDVICNLYRCEVPDELIYGIITDPEWKISSSVIDKGRHAHSYAVRQMERGKDESVDPWLRQFNERYAVIQNFGGKCRIIEEVMDFGMDRTSISAITFQDFNNAWCNQKIQVGETKEGVPQYKPAGKWWTENPLRRQYSTLGFLPGQDVGDVYNLWKGFSIDARPVIPPEDNLYLTHALENVCRGNKEYYQYLLGWMANAVQNPDSPGQVAVVLQGERGTGKSFFAKELGRLFGRHYLQVTDPKHLVGNFNVHLRDCVLLFADEAFYANDKKHESILKMLVTEETIMFEGKGVDANMGPNCTHLIMASNSEWVIPSGPFERRFFVLGVGSKHRQDSNYFKAIAKQMDAGGRESLLHYLLNYDLSEFEVRSVPKTEFLQGQVEMSLDAHESWWLEKLQNERILKHHEGWVRDVAIDDLRQDYLEYSRDNRINYVLNPTHFGRLINKLCPEAVKMRRYMGGKRKYVYRVPNLVDVRNAWDGVMGEYLWDPIESEEDFDYGEMEDPSNRDDGVPF